MYYLLIHKLNESDPIHFIRQEIILDDYCRKVQGNEKNWIRNSSPLHFRMKQYITDLTRLEGNDESAAQLPDKI